MLSFLATGSFSGTVQGLNELNEQYMAKFGPGELPAARARRSTGACAGWRTAGSFVALVALVGAFLYWKRRLERLKWFLWIGVVTSFLPFVACVFGWMLTEIGRQPWIVQGLLKTGDANSPAVGTTWLVISLTVFVRPVPDAARARHLADAALRGP